jgi:hypothetical protein
MIAMSMAEGRDIALSSSVVMPGHRGQARADCVNLASRPGVHAWITSTRNADGRDKPGHHDNFWQ